MTTQTTAAPEFASADGKLTADFWAAMPETKPYYELVEGVLKRKMPTPRMHAHAAFRLAHLLTLWGDAAGWAFETEGIGLRPDGFNGYVPDVIGFAPGVQPSGDTVYVSSAFLVAEVLSPATANNDRDAKMKGYARAEVEIYILIDPRAQTFEVYRLDGQAYGAPETLSGDATWQPAEFEGLQLQLDKLWM